MKKIISLILLGIFLFTISGCVFRDFINSIFGITEEITTIEKDTTESTVTTNGTTVTTTITTENTTITSTETETTTIATTQTTVVTASENIILSSDFGSYNSTHSNYADAYTDDVPNEETELSPSGVSSYTLMGCNANSSDWDYIKFGKKNVSATLDGLENYLSANFTLAPVSKIVLEVEYLSPNTTIYLETSTDKETWSIVKEEYLEKGISTSSEIELSGLDIKDEYLRFVFTSTATPGTANGWLLTLTNILYYSGTVEGSPALTISPYYDKNILEVYTTTEFSLPTVTAMDEVDGDITSLIDIDTESIKSYLTENNTYIITDKGEYKVTYKVTDSDKNETIYKLSIVVDEMEKIEWDLISYYSSLMKSTDEITDLAKLLRSTISYVTYGDARYNYCVNSVTGYQYVLYDTTGLNIPLSWGSGGVIPLDSGATYSVDREHIWACNNMRIMPTTKSTTIKTFPTYVINDGTMDYRPGNDSKGHFSDLHNLWNATRSANQNLHSDHFFGGTTVSWTDDTYDAPSLANSIFYPGEEYCGDVARACFYMTLVYPFLTLVNTGSSYSEGTIYYGYLDTLILWNEMDPVSEEEITRNESIYKLQGNRNPFIDFYDSNIVSLTFVNGDPEIAQ